MGEPRPFVRVIVGHASWRAVAHFLSVQERDDLMSKRKNPVWQERRDAAAAVLDEVGRAAWKAGLMLRVSQCVSGSTTFQHWMFNDQQGRRVLNYWPTRGKWGTPLFSVSGGEGLADPWAALELAKRILAGEAPPQGLFDSREGAA